MSPTKRLNRCALVPALFAFVLSGGQLWAGESPWYVTARLGEASAEAQFGTRHTKRIDDEAGSFALDLGYEVNSHLAIEVGYHDLSSHAGFGSPCREDILVCIERLASLGLCIEGFECTEVLAAIDADISGLSLALVPSWPLTERIALRGKVGLMAWDADLAAARFGYSERFSGEDLLAGVGLEYSFPGGLGLQIQHEVLDLDAAATSLGLRWQF